jgi:hypothetical protein
MLVTGPPTPHLGPCQLLPVGMLGFLPLTRLTYHPELPDLILTLTKCVSNRVWWCMPKILVTWKVEIGGL